MVLSKIMNQDSSDTLPSFSLPYKKVGIALVFLSVTQWVTSDLVHLPISSIAVLTAGTGIWWISSISKGTFNKPSSVKGWIKRCNEVLLQFESLEDQEIYSINAPKRSTALQDILLREKIQSLCITSTKDVEIPKRSFFEETFTDFPSLEILYKNSLPISQKSKSSPKHFYQNDLLLYFLPLPLRAVDLLWLEMVPESQPCWVLTIWEDSKSWIDQVSVLRSQLPERWANKILRFNGSSSDMKSVLNPIKKFLKKPSRNFDETTQRLLSTLHLNWQSDLEKIRREKFKNIQNRSQWLVAGVVFASPVPSTDVLSLAVVNGLMIKEMAQLWSCKLKPDLLKIVAKQLSIAALSQGVVEWSGQALLGAAKLHGGTWLAAGSMQALSAAYLTRVVGRSMSDWMALNNGVSEPDLNLLKQQAPKLIANAMEAERVDWKSFLKQSIQWSNDQKLQIS